MMTNKKIIVKLRNTDNMLVYQGEDIVKKKDLKRQLKKTYNASEFLYLGAIIVRRNQVEWIIVDKMTVVL